MSALMEDAINSEQPLIPKKLSELMKAHAASAYGEKPFVSIEFFPPRTEAGVEDLFTSLEKLIIEPQPHPSGLPLFVDVTWGAGGSTSTLTMDICRRIQQDYSLVANMHLTCTNVSRKEIDDTLQKCAKEKILNIVALRGDPPAGNSQWTATDGGFQCAHDLVHHIRAIYGDLFNITVAGYPEGHPNKMEIVSDGFESLTADEKGRCNFSIDDSGNEVVRVCRDAQYIEELAYLKSKVDAGADCVITQMFFDCSLFKKFVADCREIGITKPIIPGIMLLGTFGGFQRMIGICRTRVPRDLMLAVEKVKDSEIEFKRFGAELGITMTKSLIEMDEKVCGLHFYTLNSSSATLDILKAVGLAR